MLNVKGQKKRFSTMLIIRTGLSQLHSLSRDSWLKIVPGAVDLSETEFSRLWNSHPHTIDQITMFGKRVNVPRYQCLYGADIEYKYSGSSLHSKPISSPVIAALMHGINKREPAFTYNAVLVNWYRDGSHYVGAHSDDENTLVADAPIYSFSFGAKRLFRVTSRDGNKKFDYLLDDGTLVIMGGKMQQEFKHAIIKTARPVGKRINLTLRAFK